MTGLTRDRILSTAVQLADRDGFDAVTMRRVAGALDVHVSSLYNHVANAEAVTDGMVELLLDEAKLPVAPVSWEEWVRTFFAALSTIAATHPGAFTALQRRPVQGARAAATFEVALAAFTKAGCDAAGAYSAVKATTLTALTVGMEQALAARGEQLETAVDDLPAEDFPHLREVRGTVDPEAAWPFALETLVAGLRAQLRRTRAQPRA